MKSNLKYLELESLRGLAALMVIFFHIPNFNEILNLNFFKNLDLMVDLFFVLSGFVIYSAYANKILTRAELLRFQFLRFGRLYPIHIIFLMIFLSFEIARYLLNTTGKSFSNTVAFEKNNLVALIEQLFLLQSFHPGNALTFNNVAWSISVEFYTYILFGLIVLYLRSYKNVLFFMIASASVFMMFNGVGEDMLRVLRCTSGFFIGCITAMMLSKNKIIFSRYTSVILFFGLVAFVIFNQNDTSRPLIYFISAALIFILASQQSGFLNIIFRNRVLVYLGTISYSMYMSHVSVLFIANYLVKVYRFPSFMSKDGQMIPVLNISELAIYILFSIALTVFIAHCLYHFVEKPLRQRSRNFSQHIIQAN